MCNLYNVTTNQEAIRAHFFGGKLLCLNRIPLLPAQGTLKTLPKNGPVLQEQISQTQPLDRPISAHVGTDIDRY